MAASEKTPPSGFKIDLKRRILEDMVKGTRQNNEFLCLVVDGQTSTILSSCCRMFDIMEAGVMVLQNVNVKRERLDIPAIYFLAPTRHSITKLIEDFADPKKPQYKEAHLFFTTRVGENEIALIKQAKTLLARVKTFKEINVDFQAVESRAFSLDRPLAVQNLYLMTAADVKDELVLSARQLTSLCLTMNEFPYIRYRAVSPLCKALAGAVENELKSASRNMRDWQPNGRRPRGVLLIVDRSIDPVAPLMHEFTYQAMVHDLLEVQGEMCSLRQVDEKGRVKSSGQLGAPDAKMGKAVVDDKKEEPANVLVLSEDDPVWIQYRHQNVAPTVKGVKESFQEFTKSSSAVALQKKDKSETTVKDLAKAMKELPKYKQLMRQFQKHLSLLDAVMSIFKESRLAELANFEQDMATGMDDEGDKVDPKDTQKKLAQFFGNPNVDIINKMRLLLLYIMTTGGLQDSTRKDFLSEMSMKMQDCILNLQKLGIDISVNAKPKLSKQRQEDLARQSKESEHAMMRYQPVIQRVIDELLEGVLDEEAYPYITPPPPDAGPVHRAPRKSRAVAGNTAGNWRNRRAGKNDEKKDEKDDEKKGKTEEDTRTRFVIFVLGGATYSEVRTAYTVGAAKEAWVALGGSALINAKDYIKALSGMDEQDDLSETIKKSADNARPKTVVSATPAASSSSSSAAAASGKKKDDKKSAAAKDDDDLFDDGPSTGQVNKDFKKVSVQMK